MQLGREAATRTAERLLARRPWRSGGMGMGADDAAVEHVRVPARIRRYETQFRNDAPQPPAAVQRWRRRQAVRQFITSSGRLRQGAPVRANQRTASMTRR